MNWRRQLSAFAGVGAVATAFQYALMALLIHVFTWPALISSGLSYAASAILNYALNRRFVFRSRARHVVAGPRFLIIVLSGLALNLILLKAGIELLGLHWLPAQLIATAVVMLSNFGLAKFWAFRQGQAAIEEQ